MTETILSLGAPCAQADLHGITALQFLVGENAIDVTELLIKFDQPGLRNYINHAAIPSWNVSVWPLKVAVENSNTSMALQLLGAGALPQLDFETWLKAAKQSRYVSLAF